MSSQQRRSRACNECRRRKVRCPGHQPCHRCEKQGLPCTYQNALTAAASRSRLGAAARGTRIASSREPSQEKPSTSTSQSPTLFPPVLRSSSLGASEFSVPLEPEAFNSMILEFMDYMYPVCPILEEDELRANIRQMHVDNDAAALVYAFSGMGFFIRQLSKPWQPDCYRQTAEMVALALDHHRPLRFGSEPKLNRIIGCIFIQMCLLVTRRLDMAFFYLREAISLMLMRSLDDFLGEREVNPLERGHRERIYWVCFIHERVLALEGSTTVCLDPLPSLPDVADAAQDSVERGFNHIIETYAVVDKDFVRFWTGDRSLMTAKWIQAKHEQLAGPSGELEITMLLPIQQVDLIISRQWLRTVTWQMAMSKMLLSSQTGQPEGLSLFMPLRLSKQLKVCLAALSHHSIAVYNVGLVPKLFEITTTVADLVLALPPRDCAEEIRSRIQDLLLTKQFLLGLVHVKPNNRKILQEKMGDIINRLYGDSRLA
ncbi:hypothetical protein TGAM01_v210975 [Trichoderma gamsii]|uniref:Zn(2)-C6 fungal-type domain-containing protein n=1 Tax=Trichoderma gamsii TaxID=398673 RepID=A0A2P4Z797_9HYPO|nr:hypothetical protein TGAM01_v210975 [Trichoderma gamsii]PON20153.1 hypothetical protein TGAM01_v210975 [Trichoderma gamsii]